MYGSPNYWNAVDMEAPDGFVLNERLVCHVTKHKVAWRIERLGVWSVVDRHRGIYGYGDSIAQAKADAQRCVVEYWDASIGLLYQTCTQHLTQQMLMALMKPVDRTSPRWLGWSHQRQHDHIVRMMAS